MSETAENTHVTCQDLRTAFFEPPNGHAARHRRSAAWTRRRYGEPLLDLPPLLNFIPSFLWFTTTDWQRTALSLRTREEGRERREQKRGVARASKRGEAERCREPHCGLFCDRSERPMTEWAFTTELKLKNCTKKLRELRGAKPAERRHEATWVFRRPPNDRHLPRLLGLRR